MTYGNDRTIPVYCTGCGGADVSVRLKRETPFATLFVHASLKFYFHHTSWGSVHSNLLFSSAGLAHDRSYCSFHNDLLFARRFTFFCIIILIILIMINDSNTFLDNHNFFIRGNI